MKPILVGYYIFYKKGKVRLLKKKFKQFSILKKL